MWLFSKYGMFSVVLKPNGEFQLRSRARRHLLLLKARFGLGKKYKIIETLHADYGFRLVIDQSQFANIASALVSEIDYDNFKNECHDMSDPAYDRALMATWGVMHRLQMDENPRQHWPSQFGRDLRRLTERAIPDATTTPEWEREKEIAEDPWANTEFPDADIADESEDFIEEDDDEVPPTTYPLAPQSWSKKGKIDDAPTTGPFEV